MRNIEKGYAFNKDGTTDTIFPNLKIVQAKIHVFSLIK